MVANRTPSLTIIDGSTTYTFPIAMKNDVRQVSWSTHSWQAGDLKLITHLTFPFRVRLWPLTGGLASDRLNGKSDKYAKANGDASYEGVFVPPPLATTITLTNGSNPFKATAFNSLLFFIGGRYVYNINPATHVATQDKDTGVGKTVADQALFNNELITAMGESEKIWKRDTAGTWTQAGDNTFAIALGVVDSKLWRVASTNKVSNCITTPLTLASWVPASGSEYTVGDTSWPAHTIIDYQGGVWIGKGDGMYAADPTGVFHNQTPQLQKWPNSENCKGAFVAQGSLWVPSAAGLFQITLGSSIENGPEVTYRPDYRFWIRGGVEHGGNIYLLATDQASASPENTVILKMVRVGKNQYVYHEWCRLGASTKGYCITVSTVSTVPEVYAGFGNDVKYATLGLGGGRDIDDTLHVYGTASVLETGRFAPSGDDLSVVSILQGIEVVTKLRTNSSWTCDYKTDGGSYANLLTTQEGGGTAAINGPTTDYASVIRYAPSTTTGQFFEVRLTGTHAAGNGTTRDELIDLYAFGYLRPKVTDILTVSVLADGASWVGSGNGGKINAEESHRLFSNWMGSENNDPVAITVQLSDYQENKTTRFIVTDVQRTEISSDPGNSTTVASTIQLDVILARIVFGPDYGAA